jgi:hypothetical protein
MAKNTVIPTGAERSDLFLCFGDKRRSLGFAAPRTASLGMTVFIVECDRPEALYAIRARLAASTGTAH